MVSGSATRTVGVGGREEIWAGCIDSVESVGDTIKMYRFGHVSIDTETVSESVSKDTLMCVEHNLAPL